MTSTSLKFVLNIDVFVDAHKGYYAFDIAPGFWTKLKTKAESGIIVSIDAVLDEILREYRPTTDEEPDKLYKWVTTDFLPYFDEIDSDVIDAYKAIINWVNVSDSYSDAAKQEFARVADGWLVAYASANNVCLVTNEVKRDGKVAVAEVCNHFQVECVSTYKMMRKLELKLI